MEKKFLQTIWDLYAQAEQSSNAVAVDAIIRCRSHCIAGLIEDEFAYLIYDRVHKLCPNLRIWIDTPVSVGKINGRVKTIYPDILVTEALSETEYMVHHIYELKANTGWMRGGAAKVIGKMKEELDLLSKSAYRCRDDGKVEKIAFKITEKTRYDLVVLTSVNNKPGKAEEFVDYARQMPGGRIGGWLLCDQELCPKHAKHKGVTRDSLAPRNDFSEMLKELAKQFEMSRDDIINAMIKHRDTTWYVAVEGFRPRRIECLSESLLNATIEENPEAKYILVLDPTYDSVERIEWTANKDVGYSPFSIAPYKDGFVLLFEMKRPCKSRRKNNERR